MFEQAMVTSGRGRRGKRGMLVLSIALGLHVAAVGAVVFASVWQIDMPGEPQANVVWYSFEAPPLAPPPPPPPARRAATPAVVEPETPTEVVQPTTIQPEVPAPAPTTGSTEGVSDSPGSEHGMPGGVDGGIDGSTALQPAPAPPPPPDAAGPLPVGGQVQAPVTIRRVEPIYPPAAVRARIGGTVVLQAVIDRQGVVREAKVLRGGAMGLDRAALDALLQWRFRPGTLHGRPVDVSYVLTIHFEIAG